MRLFPCVFLIVLTKARTSDSKPDYDDELPSAVQKKVDVYPQHFSEPVPFGHITLAGFGDPFSPVKPPINFLEMDMITPQNSREAREMLKNGKGKIQFIRNPFPPGYVSPREKFLSELSVMPPPEDKNGTHLKWYNIAEIQRRNSMRPIPAKNMATPKNPMAARIKPAPSSNNENSKLPHFAKNMFQLKQDYDILKLNWTSCDEFAVGAFFSPKEVVNVEWVPFYIWSLKGYPYAIVHKFVYPTKKLVTEYRMKYERFLNKTVDWNQPKLLMTGMTEMLLVAADKKGLFDALTKHEIPESAITQSIKLPSLSIRLKIEDPYLVMTFCENYFATVMAISGSGPVILREMKSEAATIKFVGPGRAVWRDLDGENERILEEQKSKKTGQEDEDKTYFRVEEPLPIGE